MSSTALTAVVVGDVERISGPLGALAPVSVRADPAG